MWRGGSAVSCWARPPGARRTRRSSRRDREVGRLTSVAWSPGLAAHVALAYVRRDVVLPAVATVMPGGADAEIRELPLSIG